MNLFLFEYCAYFNQVALHSLIIHAYLPNFPLSSFCLFFLFPPFRNKPHKMWNLSTTDNSPKKGLRHDSKEEFQIWKFFWMMAESREWYCHEATSVNIQAAHMPARPAGVGVEDFFSKYSGKLEQQRGVEACCFPGQCPGTWHGYHQTPAQGC